MGGDLVRDSDISRLNCRFGSIGGGVQESPKGIAGEDQ